MATPIEFFRINELIADIGNTQLAIEPVPDSDLGYNMWGGKDGSGNITKWLAKGLPGLLQNLKLTDLAGSGDRFVSVDVDGNLTDSGVPVNNIPIIPPSNLDGAFLFKNSDQTYGAADGVQAAPFQWDSSVGKFRVSSATFNIDNAVNEFTGSSGIEFTNGAGSTQSRIGRGATSDDLAIVVVNGILDLQSSNGIRVTPQVTGTVLSYLGLNTDNELMLVPDPLTEVSWGDITGTLSDQTDLQNALDAKEDVIPASALNGSFALRNIDGSFTFMDGVSAAPFRWNQTTGYIEILGNNPLGTNGLIEIRKDDGTVSGTIEGSEAYPGVIIDSPLLIDHNGSPSLVFDSNGGTNITTYALYNLSSGLTIQSGEAQLNLNNNLGSYSLSSANPSDTLLNTSISSYHSTQQAHINLSARDNDGLDSSAQITFNSGSVSEAIDSRINIEVHTLDLSDVTNIVGLPTQPTPTLDQVTTAGSNTTNNIQVGSNLNMTDGADVFMSITGQTNPGVASGFIISNSGGGDLSVTNFFDGRGSTVTSPAGNISLGASFNPILDMYYLGLVDKGSSTTGLRMLAKDTTDNDRVVTVDIPVSDISNIGSGAEVFKQFTGSGIAQLRTLEDGSFVSFIQNANDIAVDDSSIQTALDGKQDAGSYVTIDTVQTITSRKTFDENGDTRTYWENGGIEYGMIQATTNEMRLHGLGSIPLSLWAQGGKKLEVTSNGVNLENRLFFGASTGSSLSSNGEMGRDGSTMKFVQRSRVQQMFGMLPTSSDTDLDGGDYVNPGYILSATNMVNRPSWFNANRIQVHCFHGSSTAYKTQLITQEDQAAIRTYNTSAWTPWRAISSLQLPVNSSVGPEDDTWMVGDYYMNVSTVEVSGYPGSGNGLVKGTRVDNSRHIQYYHERYSSDVYYRYQDTASNTWSTWTLQGSGGGSDTSRSSSLFSDILKDGQSGNQIIPSSGGNWDGGQEAGFPCTITGVLESAVLLVGEINSNIATTMNYKLRYLAPGTLISDVNGASGIACGDISFTLPANGGSQKVNCSVNGTITNTATIPVGANLIMVADNFVSTGRFKGLKIACSVQTT